MTRPEPASRAKPELTPEEAKNWRLAKLFDLRSFIGGLLLIFGILVIIPGIVSAQTRTKERQSPEEPGRSESFMSRPTPLTPGRTGGYRALSAA